MKKLVLTLATAMGTLGISQSVSAQYYDTDSKADRRFYLSPMATYSRYDSTRALDDSLGYQFSIGKILGRGSNLELHGNFAEADAETAGGSNAELTSYGISVLLFQWRQSLPVYGILSIAKGFAESPDSAIKAAESDQFDVGLGYMLGLGSWPLIGQGAALRVEARYRYDKYSQGEASAYDSIFGTGLNRSYHDALIGLGLYLPLGADPNREAEIDEPKATTQVVISAPDSDGDQIPDDMDACPGTPPSAYDYIDVQGCERDSDGDGVPNSQDRCHATPAGSQINEQGCPLDSDNDGVGNAADQCPNTPAGLPVLADGCALRGDCRVPSAGQRIDAQGCAVGSVVLKGVNFETASDRLTPNAKAVLDNVASALRGVEQILIEVGGHTDSLGAAAYNQALSEGRALRVKKYLELQGVSRHILSARGYGETQPLISNESAAGRKHNRRVELTVKDK